MNKKTILLVEDDRVDYKLVERAIADRYNLLWATGVGGALSILSNQTVDLILLDLSLPDAKELEAVHVFKAESNCPIVILTGVADEEMADSALREGIQDYLLKDQINKPLLLRSIRYAIERDMLQKQHLSQKSMLEAVQKEAQISLFATDNASEAIYWINSDGTFSYVNNQAAVYSGYTRNELGRLSVFDVNPTYRRDQWPEHWRETKALGVASFESTHYRKNGSSYPVRINNHFMRFEGQEFIYGSVRDITEDKRLLREQERTQLAIDRATVAVFMVEQGGNLMYVNDVACRERNYTREELLSKTVADIDVDIPSIEYFQSMIWPGNQAPVIVRNHSRKDGSVFPVEVVSNLIEVENERSFAFWYVRDLTDEQALNAKIARSAERFEWAMASANIGIWDWKPETNEAYTSSVFRTQLGYSADETWSSFADIAALLHPDDQCKLEHFRLELAQKPHQTHVTQMRLRTAAGEYKHVQSVGRGVFGDNELIERFTGVHIDVTDLQVEREALQRSNRDLEQFAYVASHDLQEPLRAIGGFLQLLKKRNADQLDEKARSYIDKSVDGAARMSQLINELLYYSRLTRVESERHVIDLNEVLDLVQKELELTIAESGVELQVGPLPSVRAASGMMNQLFQNLLTNAIKYRATSKPTVTVSTLPCASDDLFVRIEVRDNGIGIAAKYLEQIFTLFKRLHRREAYPGTGIGLAVCKRIVEQLDGTISVESTEGEGSCFTVSLPRGD